jgi:hypothetical protein
MVMPYVEALTDMDVEFGKRLWQTLRLSQTFPVNGMFWLFRLESAVWHLVIATPRVDIVGPRNAYAELVHLREGLFADSAQIARVELISPTNPLYQGLRSVFGHTASVEGARLGNTQISGMFIDDAYLYEIR